MLILHRRVGEAIRIAKDIRVVVIDNRKDNVKIGIDAPSHVVIDREERHFEILERELEALKASREETGGLAG